MNYITYPSTTMNGQNQRAIVLTPPAAPQSTSANPQQTFPIVMQMGSSSGPVFYAYQNEVHNKSNDSCSSVLLSPVSPVSPVQNSFSVLKNNGNSPTLNIHQAPSENKNVAARSLGELLTTVNIQQSPMNIQNVGGENKSQPARLLGEFFNVQNVQNVGNIQNHASIVPTCSVPVTHHSTNTQPEIANLLSSIQTSVVPVVNNSNTVVPEQKCDQAFDGLPEMYKVVDASGNVTVFTTGVSDQVPIQGGTAAVQGGGGGGVREQFTLPSTSHHDAFSTSTTNREQIPITNNSPAHQKLVV